jgi:hypothetical protein
MPPKHPEQHQQHRRPRRSEHLRVAAGPPPPRGPLVRRCLFHILLQQAVPLLGGRHCCEVIQEVTLRLRLRLRLPLF